MPRHLYAFLFLLLLLPAGARALDVQVAVEEKGRDASEARIKALAAADIQAFMKLTKERLGDRAEDFLAAYDAEAISRMVQGYEIVEESMTPDSYRATLKVNFSDEVLAGIAPLAGAGASPAAAPVTTPQADDSKAVLLLPVWLDSGSGVILWEEVNPWRDAVSKAALQARKGRWITPTGDPSDRVYADAEMVTTADYARLAPLAERYGAGRILIAIAQPGPGNLEVTLRHLSPAGEQKENLQLAGKSPASATLQDLMHRAADELLLGDHPAALTAAQKQELAVDTPQLQDIDLMLNLTRARDWAELNHRLQTIPGVEGLQVTAADWQRIKVRMTYRGKPENLGEAMAKAGLIVQQQADALLLTIR